MNAPYEVVGAIDGLLCGEAAAAGVVSIRQVAQALQLSEDRAAQVLNAYAQQLAPDRLLYASVEEVYGPCGRSLRVLVHRGLRSENDRIYGVLRQDLEVTDAQLSALVGAAGVTALLGAAVNFNGTDEPKRGAHVVAKELPTGLAMEDAPARARPRVQDCSGQAILRALLTESRDEDATCAAHSDAPAVREPIPSVPIGTEKRKSEPEPKRRRPLSTDAASSGEACGLSQIEALDSDFAGQSMAAEGAASMGRCWTLQAHELDLKVMPVEGFSSARQGSAQQPDLGAKPGLASELLSQRPGIVASASQQHFEKGRDSLPATASGLGTSPADHAHVRSTTPRRHIVLSEDEQVPDGAASNHSVSASLTSLLGNSNEVPGPSGSTAEDQRSQNPLEPAERRAETQPNLVEHNRQDYVAHNDMSSKQHSTITDSHRAPKLAGWDGRACVATGKILEEHVTANGEIRARLVDTSGAVRETGATVTFHPRQSMPTEKPGLTANQTTTDALARKQFSAEASTSLAAQPVTCDEAASLLESKKDRPAAQTGIRRFFTPRS
jgi:hypothetical protein